MMKKTLYLATLLIAIVACSDDKAKESFDNKNYEVVKETLEQQERKNPIRFLSVSTKEHKNIIGQTVVKGTITNKATIAIYKDVELRLSFFSKTGVRLDEGIESVYEKIEPGETITFKTKYFAPKGTDSVAVKITKASVN